MRLDPRDLRGERRQHEAFVLARPGVVERARDDQARLSRQHVGDDLLGRRLRVGVDVRWLERRVFAHWAGEKTPPINFA